LLFLKLFFAFLIIISISCFHIYCVLFFSFILLHFFHFCSICLSYLIVFHYVLKKQILIFFKKKFLIIILLHVFTFIMCHFFSLIYVFLLIFKIQVLIVFPFLCSVYSMFSYTYNVECKKGEG